MSLADDNREELRNTQDDVIDINMQGIKRKRFRLNGDNSCIIELNLSDLGIVDRLERGMERLAAEMATIASIDEDDENYQDTLQQADQKMREYVDYIFDSPVSEVCARHGTMYDPQDGKFRYESIIDTLTSLYHNNINAEYKKIQARISKYTNKYTTPVTKGKRKKS